MSYNKIMVHNVEYNWLRFINNPFFRKEWWFLCIKEFSFFEVATTISTEKYALRHWEYVSPTLKKNRRIRILFDILADSEKERRVWLRKVERAFAPESNPSPFNKNLWKKLTFTDIDWAVWKCNCQVLKGVELSDFWNEKRAWISVELITDSSEFKSNDENVYTEWRNTRFWKRLDTNLWFNYEYYRDIIDYQWAIDSPMKITLEITENNPVPNKKINIIHENEWENEWFQIEDIEELNLVVWNKIVIDTDSRRVYLYQWEVETDITWNVALWSQRPLLRIWDNIIAVDTWASIKTMNVKIEWNEVF